jgi:formyl-CoA transferase
MESKRMPLEGVRILDIGTAVAGPFGPTLLADFGAEVIKVELPGKGDLLRNIAPVYQEKSLFWTVEARNKKSITLDLRQPKGQGLLKQLVRISDVVVENFQPGTLEKWNLGYEALREVNEKIILIRVSGYGQDGPYRDKPGYDRIGQAVAGLIHATGYPEHPPVKAGYAVCDYMTGMMNALATMIALYFRDINPEGEGQWVDVSLYETIFRISEFTTTQYDKLGVIRERSGNRHPAASPGDAYRTKDDKWVVLLVPSDAMFQRLIKVMGQEDLIADPRFENPVKRVENAEAINAIVADWIRQRTMLEVRDILDAAEVPVAPIYNIKDIFEDPHYQAREDIIEVEDKSIGKVKMQGVFPKFSHTPGRVYRMAPDLGEHNEEVYCGLLGLSAQELKELQAEKII